MSERVHFHSWPLVRDFTFKEWCDYLDLHKGDSGEAVAEFGGWKFNVHGACLNRKAAIREYIGNTGAGFEVDVFQAPKGRKVGEPIVWNFSTYYSNGNGSGTGPWGEVEGNEDDAIRAGLEGVIRSFEKSAAWYGVHNPGRAAICHQAIGRAREMLLDMQQLSLF